MSISKIKENARDALKGKWDKGVSIILVYLLFEIIARGAIMKLFTGNETLIGVFFKTVLEIALIICKIPLLFGVSYAFIKLKREGNIEVFDIFSLGFSNFKRSWKITLRVLLRISLPLILNVVSYAIAIILILGLMFSLGGLAKYIGHTIEYSILIYCVSYIWLVVIGLQYSLITYIAFDNPNMNALDVVNESKRMMKGNRGKIFLLFLSFIGWAILAVCTLGIGFLWLSAYMQFAEICFYEHLIGKKEDNDNTENNVDAIIEM